MYKIVLPISGFEKAQNVQVEKFDEFFSIIKIDEETKIAIANIKILDKVSFDFQIDKDTLSKLKIDSTNNFETYFPVVKQEPIQNSIINLVAPIFINEKDKLIGQYIISEKVEPYLASLNKCIKL